MKEESFIRKNKGRRIAKQFEREIRKHNLINSEKREDYLVLGDVDILYSLLGLQLFTRSIYLVKIHNFD